MSDFYDFFFHLSNPYFNSCRLLTSTTACYSIYHSLTLHCVSRCFPESWDLTLGNFFDTYCFSYHRKERIVISNMLWRRVAQLNCMMCRCDKESKGQLLASKVTSKEHRQPRSLPLCQQPHPEILFVQAIWDLVPLFTTSTSIFLYFVSTCTCQKKSVLLQHHHSEIVCDTMA